MARFDFTLATRAQRCVGLCSGNAGSKVPELGCEPSLRELGCAPYFRPLCTGATPVNHDKPQHFAALHFGALHFGALRTSE